jgi:hypothetical protein
VNQLIEAFLWGLRFDLAATAALLLPGASVVLFFGHWLSERFLRWWLLVSFLVLLVPAIALNFIDIELINFVGRRFTRSTLFIFREVEGKGSGYFKDYGVLILFVLAILALSIWLT